MPVIEAPSLNGHHRRPLLDDDTLTLITKRARQARPGRAFLALIGGLLFSVGWVISKLFGVLWLSLAWCWTAVEVGMKQAQGKPLNQPRIEDVMAENAALRAELSRLQV